MAKDKESAKEAELGIEDEKTLKNPRSGGKNKTLILGILILVALLGAGAGTYFLYFNKIDKEEKGTTAGKEQKNAKEEKKDDGVNFPLDTFVVNLADTNANKFLKVSIQVELNGSMLVEKAKSKIPQIRDSIILTLTTKTSDEMMAHDGKIRLKEDIMIQMVKILGKDAVKNIFITDFVMQ